MSQTTLLTLNGVHDVWTGHLYGNALTLGAQKQAIYIPDIEGQANSEPRILHTGSDVFSISQPQVPESGSGSGSDSDSGSGSPHLIYTGLRNGSIARFDLRMSTGDKGRGGGGGKKKLFEARFTGPAEGHSHKQRSPVVHLKVMKDWQILVGNINGQTFVHSRTCRFYHKENEFVSGNFGGLE
ncbi:hypothetical protein D9758_002612 [Tetrapyrgos nigripes]|uniref:Uncharacterized protein n=1 Tax=Tetrapyrgos nigripes TaxID=182062 RepID=A0A8H5LTU8_9AGAR|nr:hypothetical protein D9758_002612 [Tetrapyrgos nigripes]